MQNSKSYDDFVKDKVIISESFGFQPFDSNPNLFPHQKDITTWAIEGGRRAIFASFGLGKTFMQLEIGSQCIQKEQKPFLIVCPLGVVGEFRRDNKKMETGHELSYITSTEEITHGGIYVTNYERIRMGQIDPSAFSGVSFDEASIIRNLNTETTTQILSYFKAVPYRFVATATPTPNDYIEILNYADYLGVISRGHALTRFFVRNSTKAGDLQLLENKKKEFWMWVSSWAVFINKPSDLGYDDEGYDLPELKIIEHRVENVSDNPFVKKNDNQILAFKDTSKSLLEVSREKRESIGIRVSKAIEITNSDPHSKFILWHHLEDERRLLESKLIKKDYRSVYGSQSNDEKEKNLIDFSDGAFQYLVTKPVIAGSGCNFQEHCSNCVFVGIDYKFNDFIQAIHRVYRFMQKKDVKVHIIYTQNEDHVFATLMEKWAKHKELQQNMIELVREYGLNNDLIKSQMQRQIFEGGKTVVLGDATLHNGDTVPFTAQMDDNSVDLIVTSIPFGDHYEYSENYNDFGHNNGNGRFFDQMDYLTPNLLRVLKPGRISAIHVKDRIRYSYQNGTSFTTIDDFSGQTCAHFQKHGFYLIGKITVTTDVVAENNQTYRLGWTEKCKDGTKMGVGLPEYIYLFRKAPTESNNAYADEPVIKDKADYSIGQWQIDAHAYWRSSGDRHLPVEDLAAHNPKRIHKLWKEIGKDEIYDYRYHIEASDALESAGKLSRKHMTLETHSNNPLVWTDVNRMNTLNAKQVSKKKEKHICPLQLDIIERLIGRYSMKGEVVYDPFGGLFSVPYKAIEMGRKAKAAELNSDYFADGCSYIKAINYKINVPTLFDFVD